MVKSVKRNTKNVKVLEKVIFCRLEDKIRIESAALEIESKKGKKWRLRPPFKPSSSPRLNLFSFALVLYFSLHCFVHIIPRPASPPFASQSPFPPQLVP